MSARTSVFVDSGAWIALAVTSDPLHTRAIAIWQQMLAIRHSLFTSVPVVIETFTFLDRNSTRDVAISWKDSLEEVSDLTILDCRASEVRAAWEYFHRNDLYKLSAVDATSFVLMKRHGIKSAFAFDHHFASAGFRMLG